MDKDKAKKLRKMAQRQKTIHFLKRNLLSLLQMITQALYTLLEAKMFLKMIL